MNRKELHKKLQAVTSELIQEKDYICFIDIFIKLGYLDTNDYQRWRMRKIPYLEKVIKVNLGKINFIMKSVKQECLNNKLKLSGTTYNSWGKGHKERLRFSKSGEENIEKLYATHFVKQSVDHETTNR